MAQQAINTENLPSIFGARVAILASKWYPDHVASMTAKCADLLIRHGADVTTHVLPGTLEFPYAAQLITETCPNVEAIVCLSVVCQGETKHFDMIIESCGLELTRVSVAFDIPIINEILPATDMSQVIARTSDDEFNKGIEAAVAAIEMISWTRSMWRLADENAEVDFQ